MTDARTRRAVHVALIVLAGLTALAVAVPSGPARPVLALLALLLLPGAAVLTRLETPDLLTWAGVAVVVSMAVDTLVSLVTVWAGIWHPLPLVVVLAAASVLALTADLRRQRRGPRAAT